MRAFIAIELPAAVRQALVKVQEELAQARADVKWVEEDHLHVTMRFLGEITAPQRQGIEGCLHDVASRFRTIQLSLSSLGAFPSPSSPRVIWVGIEQGKDELARLAQELERQLEGLEIQKEERGFVAHVTLGRVRSSRHRAQLTSQLNGLTWRPPEPFWADHLAFFQSSLTSAGAVYTPLATAPFRTPPPAAST